MSEAELQSLLSNVPVYTPLSAQQPHAVDANDWFSIPIISENYDPDED
jgi:hypothetical protein